jgi:hypothetical protein
VTHPVPNVDDAMTLELDPVGLRFDLVARLACDDEPGRIVHEWNGDVVVYADDDGTITRPARRCCPWPFACPLHWPDMRARGRRAYAAFFFAKAFCA